MEKAKGTTGMFLSYSMPNKDGVWEDHLTFRVYDPIDKKKYKDYKILHNDLKVTIVDDSACFIEKDGVNYIDYTFLNRESDLLLLKRKHDSSSHSEQNQAQPS